VLSCNLRKCFEQTSRENFKPPPVMNQRLPNKLGVREKNAENILVVLDGEQ
jgi:hypothetical protein